MRCCETASTSSPTTATSCVVGERVERDADRALERVLDRHDRAVDAAVVDGEDRVAHRRAGRRARRRRRPSAARAASSENVPAGPEVAQPHQGPLRHHDASAMRSASSSSGESLSSPLPSETCLAYSRAWSRWWIEDSTTPVARAVEQRDRGRLAAGHLVVGVVADQAAVRDRAVEAALGDADARVEPLGDLGDVAVQRAEARVERRRVADEVDALLAEHDALVGAQAPQLRGT